jgi:hypothetical protein
MPTPETYIDQLEEACCIVDALTARRPEQDAADIWRAKTTGSNALRQLVALPEGLEYMRAYPWKPADTNDAEVRAMEEALAPLAIDAERWPVLAEGLASSIKEQRMVLEAASPLGNGVLERAVTYEGITQYGMLPTFLGTTAVPSAVSVPPLRIVEVGLRPQENRVVLRAAGEENSVPITASNANTDTALRRAGIAQGILTVAIAGPLSRSEFSKQLRNSGGYSDEIYELNKWLTKLALSDGPLLQTGEKSKSDTRPDWCVVNPHYLLSVDGRTLS